MSYEVNNVAFLLQPETGQWLQREVIDYNGNGKPVYPAFREFECKWSVMTFAQFDQIQGFYEAVTATGTASVSLPYYGTANWSYKTYDGCQLDEPSVGRFFEEHYLDVTWRIRKIRVD